MDTKQGKINGAPRGRRQPFGTGNTDDGPAPLDQILEIPEGSPVQASRAAGDAAVVVNCFQAPGLDPVRFHCIAPGCDRSFDTDRGRGQHWKRAHPELRNASVAAGEKDTRAGRVWTEGEERLLAIREFELLNPPDGPALELKVKEVNSRLEVALGRTRTVQAIACRRKNPLYKTMRDQCHAELRARADVPRPPQTGTSGGASANPSNHPNSVGEAPDVLVPMQVEELRQNIIKASKEDTSLGCIVATIERKPIEDGAIKADQKEVGRVFAGWLKTVLKGTASKDQVRRQKPLTGTTAAAAQGRQRAHNWRTRAGEHNTQAEVRNTAQSRTTRRRHHRWFAMNEFRKDPYQASKKAIRGELTPLTGAQEPSLSLAAVADLRKYWGKVFRTPSVVDQREIASPPHVTLLEPISANEVEIAIRRSKENTPGQDGVKLSDLRRIKPAALATWFNVFMATGCAPEDLLTGVVTLVPKKPGASEPNEFRPITVMSKILRVFHSIMACRWDRTLDLPPAQRGFRELDGCRDNIWALKNLVKSSVTEKRGLTLAFLDAANAFGSVSHDSIHVALKRLGVPDPLLKYVRSLYSGCQITFKGDPTHELYAVNSGVLQGDPLSSVIFNAVMALVCSHLDEKLGLELGDGEYCAYICYADDTWLASRDANSLQRLVDDFNRSGQSCGLKLNAGKCSSVRIESTRRTKKSFVRAESFLTIDGAQISALDLGQTYKYLGLKFGPEGFDNSGVRGTLELGLENISTARLDPQQRLFALRRTLVPQLQHALVLGEGGQGFLESLDKLIRAYVRKWTALPHDTPVGAFHSKARDGGLAIPNLSVDVPRWRAQRLYWLNTNEFPLAKYLLGKADVRNKLRAAKELKIRGDCDHPLWTKEQKNDYWRSKLVSSVDGRGLEYARTTPLSSAWVTELRPRLSGSEYIRALHVRFAVLKTPLRAARRLRPRPAVAPRCRICIPAVESLGHVLQKCPRTHGLRISRHNSVCKLIAQALRRRGWEVVEEPLVPPTDRPPPAAPAGPSQRHGSTKGYLKPDLVCVHRESRRAVILDPTIVADNATHMDLEAREYGKQELYGNERVKRFCANLVCCDPELLRFRVIGVPITWRGLIYSCSAVHLKSELRLSNDLLQLICIRALVGSWRTWRSNYYQRTD